MMIPFDAALLFQHRRAAEQSGVLQQSDRLDPVIVRGGQKLSLNHLVLLALGSVANSVCVCVCQPALFRKELSFVALA